MCIRDSHRCDHLTESLQRQGQPHYEIGPARKHQQVGGNKGRCVDKPEAGLPQHAVRQMGDKIPRQVTLNEYFIAPFGLANGVRCITQMLRSVSRKDV